MAIPEVTLVVENPEENAEVTSLVEKSEKKKAELIPLVEKQEEKTEVTSLVENPDVEQGIARLVL